FFIIHQQLWNLKSQCLYISYVRPAIFKPAVIYKPVQRFFYLFAVLWCGLSDGREVGAGLFSVFNYFIISGRRVKCYNSPRVIRFFIRPEMPADIVFVKQQAEALYPFIRVFARLAAINGHIVFIPEIDVILYYLLHRFGPVLMKSINQL